MPISYVTGQRPYAEVLLAGKPVRMLIDSGNDITLLPTEIADRIGIPWRGLPDAFNVKGVDPNTSVPFKTTTVPLQIGNDRPIMIPVGIGELRDPLLGREGLLDNYDVGFSKGRVTFSQHGNFGNGLPISLPPQAMAGKLYCSDGACCDVRCSNIF